MTLKKLWTLLFPQTTRFETTMFPKDPAALKILRDSELLRRSVSAVPPLFTTL